MNENHPINHKAPHFSWITLIKSPIFRNHSQHKCSKEGVMPQFDTIIKNGTVVDGTRVPRYRADIGIKNGKIAQIGKLNPSDATKVVDANGLIVATGFIDLHTHYDAQLHWDPY